MEKEILTKEKIHKEIKRDYLLKIFPGVGVLVCIILLLGLPVCMVFQDAFPEKATIIRWICLGVPSFLVIIEVYTYCRVRRRILRGEYQILVDRLVKTELDNMFIRPENYKTYHLVFEKSGTYYLGMHRHYIWSELYAMTDKGIENTSAGGDAFYIIKAPHYIMAVFNTKFFEYKE